MTRKPDRGTHLMQAQQRIAAAENPWVYQLSEEPSDTPEESDTPLADLFERCRADILAFLRSRVATPEQAEDLLQQVFLQMFHASG